MLIGAMNNPARDLMEEIRLFAALGLDFIDLTLEPPGAAPWRVDAAAVRRAIEEHGLQAVGHTAYYLPLGHAFEEVRRGAVEAFRRCLELFAEVGVRWMNIHPDMKNAPMHERSFVVSRNLESIAEMAETARRVGVGLMVENLPGALNTAEQLGEFLEPAPELGLHLDIGHTNLMVEENTTPSILSAWGDRLRHVHLHDNKGGSADLHLPLGSGTLDLRGVVRALRHHGYDGTITLEVFTPDTFFLQYSAEKLRRVWGECGE